MSVVSLHDILSAFNASINEEQCWALCHQSLQTFRLHFIAEESLLVTETSHLLVSADGSVHQRSLHDETELRPKANNESEIISSLGIVLFRALDFGLHDDEERSLSAPLERLIDRLTTNTTTEDDARDEGIELMENSSKTSFDDVIQMCCARLEDGQNADTHYRGVCRALVLETLELKSFLVQISRQSKDKNEKKEAEEEVIEDWARLWLHVIRQLREGVYLRPIPAARERCDAAFELTPFERLLADIRSGVPLNRVEVTESERNKDAHELILDFIRARPSLQSAERRQLAPPPLKQETLYEKLMFSIRQKHKLKPVPKPAECAPPADDGCSRVDRETTPAPQRRLIKANLRLSFESFDDTTTEDDANDVSETTEDDGKRFSLKKLSRLLSQERRHSISVCETPREELDVNEDARQHVVSIWESCDWGRALQCLSLSLQEVQHIRNVLTKAELETLAVTKDLRSDLENGKICFTCLKTRFSFFGQWPRECQICKRVVCERCATKMHIPFANFDKVPIYMLSPTPSPPEPRKPFPEPRPQTTASAAKRWRSLRSGDAVLVDAADRKSGPLARVCRDCKRLVRHLIDAGAQNWKH